MTKQKPLGANYYQGIPEEAVNQFKAACRELLYPDGSDTLRSNAFGPFPANVLEEPVRARIESVLGDTVEHSPKERVITVFAILACDDMRFFQDVQYRMGRQDIRVPFYSAFDDVHEQRSGAPRQVDFDASGLALGMRGEGRVDDLVSNIGLGPDVARAAAKALAAKAQIPAPAPAIAEPAPAHPLAAEWIDHGALALERAGDVGHTRRAIEAMKNGRANQFHRQMTPESILHAQIELHGSKGEAVTPHARIIFEHQLSIKGPEELREMLEVEHELLDSAYKAGTSGKDDQVKHGWRYEAIRDALHGLETGHENSAAR